MSTSSPTLHSPPLLNDILQFSNSQWLLLISTRRITSIFSIIGSSVVLCMILSDHSRKLAIVKNRLMCAMSLMDIIHSIGLALATTAIPKDSQVYGAMGSTRTCDLQGVLISFGGLSTMMYNASLCLMYVCMIRYSMSNAIFLKHHRDFKLMAFIFGIAGSYSLSAAITGDYNTGTSGCFLKEHPYGCDLPESDYDCTRGLHNQIYTRIGGVVMILCFAVIVLSMSQIYWAIHKRAVKVQKYVFRGSITKGIQRMLDEKKETAVQASLYVASYLLTYIFVWILQFMGGDSTPFVMRWLNSLFGPLQGFWNAVTYIRPGYVKRRKDQLKESKWNSLRTVVLGA